MDEKCNISEIETANAKVTWLVKLLDYSLGDIKLPLGDILVCEYHPRSPYNQGYTFDCKCGGVGVIPPHITADGRMKWDAV